MANRYGVQDLLARLKALGEPQGAVQGRGDQDQVHGRQPRSSRRAGAGTGQGPCPAGPGPWRPRTRGCSRRRTGARRSSAAPQPTDRRSNTLGPRPRPPQSARRSRPRWGSHGRGEGPLGLGGRSRTSHRPPRSASARLASGGRRTGQARPSPRWPGFAFTQAIDLVGASPTADQFKCSHWLPRAPIRRLDLEFHVALGETQRQEIPGREIQDQDSQCLGVASVGLGFHCGRRARHGQ
jgi:hypothetical protein